MPLGQVSRWTLVWFAQALAFLLLALGLAVMGLAGPGHWSEGAALSVLHLFALGWLSQMMLGALVQFVPVLTARPLLWPGLALPGLILGGAGTLALATGFLALDGWEEAGPLLMLGPVLLGLAFALVLAMLAGSLIVARGWRQDDGLAVLAGLCGLIPLWISGAAMIAGLRGMDFGLGLVPDGLPQHAMLAIAGWLSLATMGVSLKLFPMFLVAPEHGSRRRRGAIAIAILVPVLAFSTVLAGIFGLDLHSPAFRNGTLIAQLCAMMAGGLYLIEVRRIWHSRRRPKPEANMSWSRAALAFLALALVLAWPGLILGGRWAEAAVLVALAGWLSTLTLAQMVKIVSFLTWIQIFAPRIGRAPVPMVQDLTDGRATGLWLGLWGAGVLGGTLATLAGQPLPFRIAALLRLIAVLGLCRELIAIRRLRHLPPDRRPAYLPPLILPPPILSPNNRSSDHDHPHSAGA